MDLGLTEETQISGRSEVKGQHQDSIIHVHQINAELHRPPFVSCSVSSLGDNVAYDLSVLLHVKSMHCLM